MKNRDFKISKQIKHFNEYFDGTLCKKAMTVTSHEDDKRAMSGAVRARHKNHDEEPRRAGHGFRGRRGEVKPLEVE